MKNINLLYCFDEGYNLQTYASIYSISKNLKNCKLSIYIIHKNPNTFQDYLNKINNFENVDLVSIYQFEKDLSDYPFLKIAMYRKQPITGFLFLNTCLIH